MDLNLVLRMGEAPSAADVFVGFWTGEMYQFMSGYAFVTTKVNLTNFSRELAEELTRVEPAGRLP